MIQNDLLLKALAGEKTKRPPVWLMRQAGRYMASYRALREKYDFLTLCKTPELVLGVTLLPIQQFGFDAAIVFSDILLLIEAMGIPVSFIENSGPVIHRHIETPNDIAHLYTDGIKERMDYLFSAIKQLKKELSIPLLGFAGAPFTLASYLIEGKSSSNLKKTKLWMLHNEESFTELLDILSEGVIEILNAQIDAGVDAVQIFDSWAHVLPYTHFQKYCTHYLQKIIKSLKPCPTIIFSKAASFFVHELVQCAPSAISFDSLSNLTMMRKTVPPSLCIQGNIDPHVLLASQEVVQKEVNRLLTSMKGEKGFIVNLGHGVLPETSEENVHALVSCVKNSG